MTNTKKDVEYIRYTVKVPMSMHDKINQHMERTGLTRNAFFCYVISEYIDRYNREEAQRQQVNSPEYVSKIIKELGLDQLLEQKLNAVPGDQLHSEIINTFNREK